MAAVMATSIVVNTSLELGVFMDESLLPQQSCMYEHAEMISISNMLPEVSVAKLPSYSVSELFMPLTPSSPPLPLSRTIGELISQRARDFSHTPILGYPSQGLQYEEYTYAQLDEFSSEAAAKYSTHVTPRTSSQEPERIIALLGASSLDYFITALALSRLGFIVLFLSTRISTVAYISLLDATHCETVIVDASFQRTAATIQSRTSDLQVLNLLDFSQYSVSTSATASPALDLDVETHKICWIIHSSGSTGLPKPIYQTHQAALHNYKNNMNMRGLITLPLFHAHGLSSVFRAICSKKLIYMYNSSLPLTRPNLLNVMHQHQFEIFYGVPYALKLLSETEDGVKALAALKLVMFGGSACPDALGDQLVQGGVRLVSHYGTTETGQLMTSSRPPNDNAWNYVRVNDVLRPYVRWEDRGGNLFELVVLSGWPSKVATNRSDGAYATKDLFEPHPTIPRAWKYSGRLDDTMILVNGEKANPVAMEQAVRKEKLVGEALVFGSGKSRLGLMVIASQLASEMTPDELIQAVWPTIEEENKNCPAYARLTTGMISVLPAGTEYPATDKGTIVRQAFYKKFAENIEEVYTRLEAHSPGVLVLSSSDMRAFLRTKVLEFLPNEDASCLQDDTDLFSLGIDSLQSAILRGTILEHIQLNGHALPQNIVFEAPTIVKLADELIMIRDSKTGQPKDVVKEMRALIAKYGNFPRHVPRPTALFETACVVVTGATGSLGAHIVAQLALRNDIDEIYCLVRAKSDEAARFRVISSMRERAVYHSLPLAARQKIICYKSDFADTRLGLGDEVYQTLAQKITTVIHCAWSVNFNKSLSSFEADCIAGARHLILLCLAAQRAGPASFNFCSSVSTVVNTPDGSVAEAVPDFTTAQEMGYAQSKLVTETLVMKAAAQTGMQARVLRVGQIVADTKHGIWNDTEAIPLMLQAATTFNTLPALDEEPRWLPVDIVGATVVDISLSSTAKTVFNVVNPKTFHWTRDLLPCLHSAGLSFEAVNQKEWIRRLRASNPDPSKNPTIKLLEFFAKKYDNDVTKRKTLGYKTMGAEALSPALASTPQLSQELVTKFVKHFLATSWAEPLDSTSPMIPKTKLLVVPGPCAWIEGGAVHDSIAITKMSSGVALGAIDRQIWLARLHSEVLKRVRAAQLLHTQQDMAEKTMMLTCSALRREYRESLRDILRVGTIRTYFPLLQASEAELIRRVGGRKGHYMKETMVRGQLAAAQQPLDDEIDVLPVDAERGSVENLVTEIVASLE